MPSPPLKWAGGKRWLVPHLKPIWEKNQHRRLVEPFCGGLAIALGLAPSQALLNDMNPHLINFYRQLQQGLKITLSMENDSDLFYAHRARFNDLIHQNQADTPEAAALFYYLNRTGYNGLCRFNKRGGFNVPFGRHRIINYVTDFSPYQAALAGWTFQADHFENIPLAPDDFVYADPPYDVEFVQYSKEGFTWENQVRLAEWLAQHNGIVILSNQATERIISLYEKLGFTLHFLSAPRRISSDGDRSAAREVLAIRGL